MLSGRQYICLHGAGGLGKTTALQQIESSLPKGSVFVTFDCYGGGSYLNAAHFRHRPQDAFVQLSNELSERLLLPTYLVPGQQLDYPRQFMKRLRIAASLLTASEPNALLVIALDAVDNASLLHPRDTAPGTSIPSRFLHFRQSSGERQIHCQLPNQSARRGGLPGRYHKVELEAFDPSETATFVRRFWQAPTDWLTEFQALSHGVPRVQAYALEAADPDFERAIDALRPNGKALDQVFADQIQTAVQKHGGERLVSMFCAAVTEMQRPVRSAIRQRAWLFSRLRYRHPYGPDASFLIADGAVNFADEDFEAYTREQGAEQLSAVRTCAADHFLSTASSSAYGALSIAPALSAAGRHQELLDFVEKEPNRLPV